MECRSQVPPKHQKKGASGMPNHKVLTLLCRFLNNLHLPDGRCSTGPNRPHVGVANWWRNSTCLNKKTLRFRDGHVWKLWPGDRERLSIVEDSRMIFPKISVIFPIWLVVPMPMNSITQINGDCPPICWMDNTEYLELPTSWPLYIMYLP